MPFDLSAYIVVDDEDLDAAKQSDMVQAIEDDLNALESAIPASAVDVPAIVDAKGDLLVASAADTLARLAVGTNAQVLTADSAETTGVKWATPATPASAPRTVTGIIPAAGTTATAGTGFTYTHTAASGIYVFSYSVAFPATPIVVATANGTDAVWPIVTAVSASGFTVEMTNGSNARADRAFSFLAHAVA